MNSETKNCQSCHQEFRIEPEDFAFYERIKVPPPTWCPECRLVRRLSFRNERSLYKDSCDLCGKEIVSMYAPEGPFTVYCNSCWFSDKWDGKQFGKDFDPSKPFFEQFAELLISVPRMALEAYQNENSPYSNFTWIAKNVYLSPSTMYSENIAFCFSCWHTSELFDCYRVDNSQLGYEILESSRCSTSRYIIYGAECLDSAFLFDCRNCRSCFMSSNLRNKSYVFRNEQLSPDEYKKRISLVDFGSYHEMQNLIKEYRSMSAMALRKFAAFNKGENFSGDILGNVKNAHYCFSGTDVENVKYGGQMLKIKDSMDIYGAGPPGELLYEGVNVGYNDSLILFSSHTFENMNDVQYCDYCRLSGDHLFGCAGLHKGRYSILNKQYTEEEYKELVPRIISRMGSVPYTDKKGRIYKYGEFFPSELSPFAYNETIAQEFFPLSKERTIESGFRWRDSDIKEYKITRKPEELLDNIKDVGDDIFKETIECSHKGGCVHQCTSAFRIIPEELAFYRRMNLPLPRLCPNCRHYERLAQRNPMKLWHRKCQCAGVKGESGVHANTVKHQHGEGHCPNEFETSYAPERPETVYCESCYNSEIV